MLFQALDALLVLSSSYEQPANDPGYNLCYKDDTRYPIENCDTVSDVIYYYMTRIYLNIFVSLFYPQPDWFSLNK